MVLLRADRATHPVYVQTLLRQVEEVPGLDSLLATLTTYASRGRFLQPRPSRQEPAPTGVALGYGDQLVDGAALSHAEYRSLIGSDSADWKRLRLDTNHLLVAGFGTWQELYGRAWV
jgi:hypothetical protein